MKYHVPLEVAEDLWRQVSDARFQVIVPVLFPWLQVPAQKHFRYSRAAFVSKAVTRDRKCRMCLGWIREARVIDISSPTKTIYIHPYPCVVSAHDKAAVEARRVRLSTPQPAVP